MTEPRRRPQEADLDDAFDRSAHDSEMSSDPTTVDEEGRTYRPPDDPPLASAPDGEPRVAAGFAGDARSEPYDRDHHRGLELGADEATEQVREALLADALGSQYVDRLAIERRGSVVVLEGAVDDIDVQEHLLDVALAVSGVTEVVDRLQLPEPPGGDVASDTRAET